MPRPAKRSFGRVARGLQKWLLLLAGRVWDELHRLLGL